MHCLEALCSDINSVRNRNGCNSKTNRNTNILLHFLAATCRTLPWLDPVSAGCRLIVSARTVKLIRWVAAQAGTVPLLKMTTENNTNGMRNVCVIPSCTGSGGTNVPGVLPVQFKNVPCWSSNRASLTVSFAHYRVTSQATTLYKQYSKLLWCLLQGRQPQNGGQLLAVKNIGYPWLMQPEWRLLSGNYFYSVIFLTTRDALSSFAGRKMCNCSWFHFGDYGLVFLTFSDSTPGSLAFRSC